MTTSPEKEYIITGEIAGLIWEQLHNKRCKKCPYEGAGINSGISEHLYSRPAKESSDKVLDIREPVLWFARQMENKLKLNDSKKGGWQDYDQEMVLYLLGELEHELQELKNAIYNSNIGKEPLDFGIFKWTEKNVIEESADVANFAMMIADNARGIKEPRTKER